MESSPITNLELQAADEVRRDELLEEKRQLLLELKITTKILTEYGYK